MCTREGTSEGAWLADLPLFPAVSLSVRPCHPPLGGEIPLVSPCWDCQHPGRGRSAPHASSGLLGLGPALSQLASVSGA